MKFLSLALFCIVLSCNSVETKPSIISTDTVTDADTLVVTDEPNLDLNSTIVADTLLEVIESISPANQYMDTDWQEYEASMTQDYSYVILISTKSYEAALERAVEAAEKLGYPLDLRGLSPNEETGLSLPVEVCEQICGGIGIEFPQYLPRDNFGDTKYVSVEYSDGYQGFTKGYFIVIAASGEKGSAEVQQALKESKVQYEDAYAKTCGVWMGCGC